jgi:hypothetical protein
VIFIKLNALLPKFHFQFLSFRMDNPTQILMTSVGRKAYNRPIKKNGSIYPNLKKLAQNSEKKDSIIELTTAFMKFLIQICASKEIVPEIAEIIVIECIKSFTRSTFSESI